MRLFPSITTRNAKLIQMVENFGTPALVTGNQPGHLAAIVKPLLSLSMATLAREPERTGDPTWLAKRHRVHHPATLDQRCPAVGLSIPHA